MQTEDLLGVVNELYVQRGDYNHDFLVKEYPGSNNHKIGLNKNLSLCLLIKSINDSKSINHNFGSYRHVRVLFEQQFDTYPLDTKIRERKNYTVIELIDSDNEIQFYFLHICTIIISKLGETPKLTQTLQSINYLLDLFSKILSPARNTVQGLWSELLIIKLSSDVDKSIEAWHINNNDRFDFNFGQTRLEVKSTSAPSRVHRFSIDQIRTNTSSNLIIASILILESGSGQSIFDLVVSIESRIVNFKNKEKIHENIFNSLGGLTNKIKDIKFDISYSIDSLKYYDYLSVPSIDEKDVPGEISRIRCDINLEFSQFLEGFHIDHI
jgi:hypothetical protein